MTATYDISRDVRSIFHAELADMTGLPASLDEAVRSVCALYAVPSDDLDATLVADEVVIVFEAGRSEIFGTAITTQACSELLPARTGEPPCDL
ncbi:MAG: hypothetical protein ACOCYW_00190 [Roseicyclus sp.]